MSIRFVLCITCARSLNISDSAVPSFFPGARIDLSAEDNTVALALAECPARPYAELIKSDISGPLSLSSARSVTSRPLPPSTMRAFPIRPSAANPTRGELLAQLETLSRKPRSVKQKTSGSSEKDRPASAKVLKLGVSPSSPSMHVRELEPAPSPLSEAFTILSSQLGSRSAAKAKSLLGRAVDQPLAVMPITVWNPPMKGVRLPPRRAEEFKKKEPESKSGGDGDSLLLNAELAERAVSSILKDSDLKRSKALLADEALTLSLQGVASVSSLILLRLFSF